MTAANAGSPFHPGEQAVQARLGVRETIEPFARRVIRDHMPDQHRAFYGELPFVLLGTVDDLGRPWASLVAGQPGFITSPDPQRLEIAARPLAGDPLDTTLKVGREVGVLGIQFETRRRNRLTGRIASIGDDGFAIAVDQAFGNCPQYIQARAVLPIGPGSDPSPVVRLDRFDARTRELIAGADTLFIATAYRGDGRVDVGDPTLGADVSHRGGKPGFVRVEDERTFVFPDFSGNNHFNTVGNILLNPKAGFLFVDFETRDLVYLTGAAEIVWEGPEVRAFAGAERLIRFHADAVIRIEGGLPLRFDFRGASPMLVHTGSWSVAAETIAAEKERNVYLPYEIFDVRPESATITSFSLRRADGKAPARYDPGQFLPIRVTVPGDDVPALRTYTLSAAPNGEHYRLSIKREGGSARVSTFLHDQAKPGFRMEAMAPRGKFVLDTSSERPVVLVSAGVGITPMIAMLDTIVLEAERTRRVRRVVFVHGARNGREHAFGAHVRHLAARHPFVRAHIRYSQPDPGDRLGTSHDSEGHVDLDLLKSFLPLDDYDFYLCGPGGFMRSIQGGLRSIGVREERIRYESFGPATLLNTQPRGEEMHPQKPVAEGPVKVGFATSGIDATWQPEAGTLLELAEAAGLSPPFSCRSGICGTCATRIRCGTVDYLEEPSAPVAEGEVLICCSTPRSTTGPATCGADLGIVLDL